MTTTQYHGPLEISIKAAGHATQPKSPVSPGREKNGKIEKNYSNKTPPVKFFLKKLSLALGNERNMCIERVPSLRTAPTRNFDGVMLVLIRHLVQPARRGNATHQVHRRRHVNDQNSGCWCISGQHHCDRLWGLQGEDHHARVTTHAQRYNHDKRTTHTPPKRNPIQPFSNDASRCGVAW